MSVGVKLFTILICAFSSLAHAGFNPKAYDLNCKNMDELAKEAVAYSLVGAWEPYANHKCFAKQKFKFFRPELGKAEGEVIDASKLIKFRNGRDSYAIQNMTKNGDEHLITVNFNIDKKTFSTTYRYVPDSEYTGRTGICGFVTNPTHKIIREDCIQPSRR